MSIWQRIRNMRQPLSPEEFVRRPAYRELREAERGLLEQQFKAAQAQALVAYYTTKIDSMRNFIQELGR